MLALTPRVGWLLCGLIAGSAGATTVYRYTDASGETVFSATLPPGATAETLIIDSPPAREPAQSAIAEPVKPKPPKVPAAQGPSAATRAANCERARRALSGLEKNPRLRVRKQDGDEYYMDGEERARRIATAEKSVAAWCEPAHQDGGGS